MEIIILIIILLTIVSLYVNYGYGKNKDEQSREARDGDECRVASDGARHSRICRIALVVGVTSNRQISCAWIVSGGGSWGRQ